MRNRILIAFILAIALNYMGLAILACFGIWAHLLGNFAANMIDATIFSLPNILFSNKVAKIISYIVLLCMLIGWILYNTLSSGISLTQSLFDNRGPYSFIVSMIALNYLFFDFTSRLMTQAIEQKEAK